jgi:lipopolysaccharide export system permease protein
LRILSRYIVKEHLGPLAFALTTLTSLLLLNYIAKQFGQLVGKGLGWGVIGEFFLLSIPFTVAMTLPMAVLVSTLYAFSRLASENEITAMKASGVGMMKMMVPVFLGAAVLAAAMLGFNDQVLPRANHRLRKLQSDIGRKKPTFALREQVINEVQPGRFFLRANHLEESSNKMREVTIYDLSNPTTRRTIYADSGNMGMTADFRDLELTLYNGWMQELPKDQPGQLQRLFYVVDLIRVRGVGNQLERSTDDTYKSDREMSICEMQKEFQDAEREVQAAEYELEQTLTSAVHTVATGESPPPRSAPKYRPSMTLARAYCQLLTLFSGPKVAEAAALPQQPAPGTRPPPPVPTRKPGTGPQPPHTGSALRGAAARAAQQATRAPVVASEPPKTRAPRPGIPLMAIAGSLEGARARLEGSRRAMDSTDVEIQKKFALSAACIVFVLMGAPIALRFPRGGVGLVIGVSLGVFALYYIGLIAGESLGDRGILSPFMAMWAANILFTAVGALLLSRMGKEGATSRGGDTGEMMDALRVWIAKQGRRVGLHLDRRRHR